MKNNYKTSMILEFITAIAMSGIAALNFSDGYMVGGIIMVALGATSFVLGLSDYSKSKTDRALNK